MAKTSKQGARARVRARRLALQGLYQWQLSGALPDEIIAQLYASQNTKDTDTDYFEELLAGAIAGSDKLSAAFAPYLDRPTIQLDPIERAILLLSTYELDARPDVPYRVVLNEAVELARKFGAEDSHKYINAVLDQTAAELRAIERGSRTSHS
ncbi:MAG: transcription antitermination factor NusB [Gammaproteobacteria bacterium]